MKPTMKSALMVLLILTCRGLISNVALRNAATKWKLGKDVLRSVVVTNNPLLEFEGSKNAVDMLNSRSPKLQLAAFTGRGVWVNRLYHSSLVRQL
jgi:hypothetical protein